MKNQKGISLIALIITIIVIIILAAIVIGGVFNTPNDAKFANFCQEYDRVQTAIQLRYYNLYQNYAIAATTEIPTHYQIYYEVATGTAAKTVSGTTTTWNYPETFKDTSRWVEVTNWTTSTNKNGICEAPSGLSGWYLRTNDGKLAYNGFEKEEKVMYYTPSISQTGTASGAAGRLKVAASTDGSDLTTVPDNTTDLNKITTTPEAIKDLAK